MKVLCAEVCVFKFVCERVMCERVVYKRGACETVVCDKSFVCV